MTEQRVQNELVLSPGEYAFTQDLTSGVLKVHTGPTVVNVTGQEYPVNFDTKTLRFKKVNLTEASQQFVTAQQGQYIVLSNPAVDRKQPQVRNKAPAADLNNGQKENIQGPTTFALWPGQSAEVIDGHNLRSNQYLLIRVRDEQLARDNWTKGVIKAITEDASDTQRPANLFAKVPVDLAVGKHYIVRGDQFSFYIPPTGVEVVKESNGNYVRDAVTLERLEYCILIDENGTKRYERGPKVVFPAPTEKFLEQLDTKGAKHIVFQPIELNKIQGIHVKVISDYKDEFTGEEHKEGDELFITGDKTPIYFPRPEHSMVSYDRKHKHFATAVPKGEARYLLERETGEINMVRGPTMLLPDPRSQVIVRRVLTDKQCMLWYPGNLEAQRYNATLRELSRATSSTRGAISEGEVERSKKIRAPVGGNADAFGYADRSRTHSETLAIGVEEFERSATYTEPRTLTLDTKFSGVPTVDVWTGYAVMVVTLCDDVETRRRVEVGPKRILLEYDETLQPLTLSTGKPKTTDNPISTVYLQVKNNQISDLIAAETKDHVNVQFKVVLRGDFTGEPTKWFDVENYVKLVSDHVRSVVKAAVRQKTIEELYADPTSMLRDAILGVRRKLEDGTEARPGMVFSENGFHLGEVELLGFTVGDDRIAKMLDNTQHQVVESNIGLQLAEKKLMLEKRQEEIERERAATKSATQKAQQELNADLEKFSVSLEQERVLRNLTLSLERLTAQATELKKKEEALALEQKLLDAKLEGDLARKRISADLDTEIAATQQELYVQKLQAETANVVERFNASSGTFAEALVALNNQQTLVKIAEATGIANYVGGPNLTSILKDVFQGTALENVITTVVDKATPKALADGNASTGTEKRSRN